MTTIDSLPDEILTLILRNCDSFCHLQNLILTSKRIYSAWICNQRVILWHVGQSAIPGFSDALIAVRATEIAKEALLRGDLPPDPFPISELSGDVKKPSLNDLKLVQDFANLARYLEKRTRSPHGKDPDFLPHQWYFESLAWEDRTWKVWQEGYHRAIYRYLTAGAVLCRAYCEPIVSPARPSGFLSSLLAILEGIAGANHESEYPTAWFSEDEQRYLSTISLYSSQNYENWEVSFQPLEALFVKESRKQQAQPGSSSRISHQPSEGLGRSLYHIFGSKARNLRSLDPAHAESLFHQILHFLYLVDGELRCLISLPGDTPLESTQETRTKTCSVSAILFGSFTLMKINILQSIQDDDEGTEPSSAFASPVLPTLQSSKTRSNTTTATDYLGFQNMHNFLKKVWDIGGIPNCYDNDPIRKTPPPVSFFAEYMLRKYFGLRFAWTMFDCTLERRCAWYAFHQYGGIFTGHSPCHCQWYVGQDMLLSVDEHCPMLCYDEYAWYY